MLFQNEMILIASVFVYFGAVLLFFRLFAKTGLYMWTVICTIAANIEVLILVNAFGMEQTLGNVLFASSFLVTDIISEVYGKKKANKCVWLGIATNITFIAISQSWFLFIPSENDFMSASIKAVFSNTPRIMIASLVAYAISELYDVWAYHFLWNLTTKKTGDSKRFLWLRNNGSTLVSQLINIVIFNLLAFMFTYDAKTVISIILSGYAIYIATSLLDTPFLYLARKMSKKIV
ncbi:queuosine precursor transporter [Treponema pectinovorum]|uniref:queuosine precursor transporter n=1 Tax=Treponema pectinovorum TaxID=164 RepID=UPI0011C8F1D6|nr:queuosine precursor transporter [Treponema pectinovorum]